MGGGGGAGGGGAYLRLVKRKSSIKRLRDGMAGGLFSPGLPKLASVCRTKPLLHSLFQSFELFWVLTNLTCATQNITGQDGCGAHETSHKKLLQHTVVAPEKGVPNCISVSSLLCFTNCISMAQALHPKMFL